MMSSYEQMSWSQNALKKENYNDRSSFNGTLLFITSVMPKHPRTISKHLDYENPYMKVHTYVTSYPDGRKRDYFVLDRRGDFSIVIPFFEDGSTLLVGQYRVPIQSYSWEFPMGTVYNKTPLQIAKQELREETGLTGRSFIKIGTFRVSPGHSMQSSHVFVVKNLTQGNPDPEPFEILSLKRVKVNEVKTMIKNGTIKDGPTIVANSFLENYLTSL